MEVVYIQIEDNALEYSDNVIQKDNLAINMAAPPEPESLVEYIEG
jgi:hypothetical protein